VTERLKSRSKGEAVPEDVAENASELKSRSDVHDGGVDRSNGATESSQSTLRRAVKAGALAAAAGTTVAAAARIMGSKTGDEREGSAETARQRGSGVRGAASRASKRGEPFISAGWEAARDSLLPLAESSARAAGKFAAEHSPELLRDRILPPFIEGFTQARRKAG
jgi:hypothetical protein